jgi:4-amino-4-deoxy-L-arabinose transferase-like glycosyltransferase
MNRPALNQSKWWLAALCGAVLIGLLFVLPSTSNYHPDESAYTDAAIRMTRSGNFITPYAATGALRFDDPILPYWAVLGGYTAFGISLVSSRVIFLIAGVLVVFLTYQAGLELFKRRMEAGLAALIIGCNYHLLMAGEIQPGRIICWRMSARG